MGSASKIVAMISMRKRPGEGARAGVEGDAGNRFIAIRMASAGKGET